MFHSQEDQISAIIHAIKTASYKHKLSIGDLQIQKLSSEYGSLKNFIEQSQEIEQFKSLHQHLNIEKSSKQLLDYQKLGIKYVNYFSDKYPSQLKKLKNAPSIIYYYGNLNLCQNSHECISIVGTRNASLYGKHMTRALVNSINNYNCTIVSGLARGIDSEAHINALENNTPTIAVLGSGLLQAKSLQRGNLFTHLLKNPETCLIMSEFEPNQKAERWTYAMRNRIIAALGKASIVVEAGKKSGALITADEAIKLEHPVFVLPGDLSKDSFKGSHQLLAEDKAEAIYSIEKLAETLELKERKVGIKGTHQKSLKLSKRKLNEICTKILKYIDLEPVSFDYLLNSLGINQISLSSNLSILEINGYIRKHSGARFSKL